MKNTLIYMFLFLLFTCSTCERNDANPSSEIISLQNNSNSDIKLNFFENDTTSLVLNRNESIILYGQKGLDFFGVLPDYPLNYDSVQFISNGMLLSTFYGDNISSNACLVEKNPLCLEQYEKTVTEGKKGATIVEYLLVIE